MSSVPHFLHFNFISVIDGSSKEVEESSSLELLQMLVNCDGSCCRFEEWEEWASMLVDDSERSGRFLVNRDSD